MSKIGINGFGRIGRPVLRRLLETGQQHRRRHQRPHLSQSTGLSAPA